MEHRGGQREQGLCWEHGITPASKVGSCSALAPIGGGLSQCLEEGPQVGGARVAPASPFSVPSASVTKRPCCAGEGSSWCRAKLVQTPTHPFSRYTTGGLTKP